MLELCYVRSKISYRTESTEKHNPHSLELVQTRDFFLVYYDDGAAAASQLQSILPVLAN